MINILDYETFPFQDCILDTMRVFRQHREYEVKYDVSLYYIELPKFRKQNSDMNDKLNQWIHL